MALRKGKAKKAKEKKDKEQAVEAGSDDVKKAKTAADEKDAEDPAPEKTELEKITEERDEYLDRFQRATADFANFQKRMRRDVDDARKYAATPFALELLSVIDNLERALESASQSMDDGFLQGFTMIREQILALMEKNGVTPIEAVNKPFDPNFHDALLEVEDDSLPDKTVVDELEKGYMIHERLLRPTRVRVSRVPSQKKDEDGKGASEAEPDEGADARDDKTGQDISSESRNKETKE